mgnify:CR=1 FL=1
MPLHSIEAEAADCRAAFASSGVGQYAWHVHHDRRVEQLVDIPEARIAYILAEKPVEEQAQRLRAFRPVRDQAAIVSAELAYREAVDAASSVYHDVVLANEAEADGSSAYEAAAVRRRKSARYAYYDVTASARCTHNEVVAAAHSTECGCTQN